MGGGGDPVADHRHHRRPGRGVGGGERHGVLVAVVPQAAIGHAGHYPEVGLLVITARPHLAAAGLAVAVRADAR